MITEERSAERNKFDQTEMPKIGMDKGAARLLSADVVLAQLNQTRV
jgi:hypothetical protein